jgi:lysophospholipase L1-like esterase
VSLGDSVASGEGNPDRPNTKNVWDSNEVWQNQKCHRTAKSGPTRAALDLERSDLRTSVTFVHLACSGAQITAGILDPYPGIEPDGVSIPPQVNVMKQLMDAWNRKPDAVLISVGANDAEFAKAVERCLLPDRCQNDAEFVAEVSRRINRLPLRFTRLDQKLDALGIPGNKVFITEYFNPTRDENAQFTQCLPTLYPSEWQWAEANVINKLNEQVRAAARATGHGWNFVGDIASGFLPHGYCASEEWVVRLEQSLNGQGDPNGAFHPNGLGQVLYGKKLFEAVKRTLS